MPKRPAASGARAGDSSPVRHASAHAHSQNKTAQKHSSGSDASGKNARIAAKKDSSVSASSTVTASFQNKKPRPAAPVAAAPAASAKTVAAPASDATEMVAAKVKKAKTQHDASDDFDNYYYPSTSSAPSATDSNGSTLALTKKKKKALAAAAAAAAAAADAAAASTDDDDEDDGVEHAHAQEQELEQEQEHEEQEEDDEASGAAPAPASAPTSSHRRVPAAVLLDAALALMRPLPVPAPTATALLRASELAPTVSAAASSATAGTGAAAGGTGGTSVKSAAVSSILASLGVAPATAVASSSDNSSKSKAASSSSNATTPAQSARTHAETHGPWARFVPSAAGAASTATSSSSAAGYGVRDPSSDVLTSAGGVRGALAPWANGPRALVLSELARANGVHELYKVFRKKTDSFIRRNAYNEFENWLLTLRAKAAATTAGAAVAKALTVTETAPRADGDDDDDDSAAAVESVNEFDEDVEGDGRAIALGANGGMPDPERRKTRSFALATAGAALVPAKASDPKEKLRNAAAMAAAGATIGIAPLTQPSLALSDPLLPATEAVATDVGLGTRLVAAGATPQEAAEVCRVLSSRTASAIEASKTGGSFVTSNGDVAVLEYWASEPTAEESKWPLLAQALLHKRIRVCLANSPGAQAAPARSAQALAAAAVAAASAGTAIPPPPGPFAGQRPSPLVVDLTLFHFIKLFWLFYGVASETASGAVPAPASLETSKDLYFKSKHIAAVTAALNGATAGNATASGAGVSANSAAVSSVLAALPAASSTRQLLGAMARGEELSFDLPLPAPGAAAAAETVGGMPSGGWKVGSAQPVHLPFPHQFAQCLLAAALRYKSLQGGTSTGGGNQAALPYQVFDALKEDFGVTTEAFASPFNCRFARYCSAFPDTDAPFGSLGSFFRFAPRSGSYQVNPPFDDYHMYAAAAHCEELLSAAAGAPVPVALTKKRLAAAAPEETAAAAATAAASAAVAAATSPGPLSFVFVMPAHDHSPAWQHLSSSPFLRSKLRIPARKHAYYDGLQHAKTAATLVHAARHDTAVFVLQNNAGAAVWGVTREKMMRLALAFEM